MTHAAQQVSGAGRVSAPQTGLNAPRSMRAGRISLLIDNGAVRTVRFGGVEVLRGLDTPIRDENWATLPLTTDREDVEPSAEGFSYRRAFSAGEDVSGVFTLSCDDSGVDAKLTADVALTFHNAASLNRAGFTVLHPLAGVTGAPLTARHSDGSSTQTTFPEAVSPGQPVFDLSGLSHTVNGVSVDMEFAGEVFEMEDQRNWTDASYKTYCRPLGWPRPFAVGAGESIRQSVTITLSGGGAAAADEPNSVAGVVPQILLALDDAISPISGIPVETTKRIAFDGIQLRCDLPQAPAHMAAAAGLALPIDLELVTEGAVAGDIAARIADLRPRRVTALPAPYLKSIQPEGPWPVPTPADTLAAARDAFPDAEIGAGCLTNFTEFNRCPPAAPSDFTTFGTTAIVHAADDASVVETLEALPHVMRSARRLSGARPVRMGLVSIAMRSNPYGAGVVDNPGGAKLAMAMDDPRQATVFSAAFAVGALAAAIREGIASLSLSMATGPLGILTAAPTRALPLFHVVRAAAVLAGKNATVHEEGGRVTIIVEKAGICGLVANLSHEAQGHDLQALGAIVLPNAPTPPDFLSAAPLVDGVLTLRPRSAAVLVKGEGVR